jgi:hypothetical protein
LLASPASAQAASWTQWLDPASPWTIWLGGASGILLAVALILAAFRPSRGDESVYRKPRRFEPMALHDTQGAS